ncbi:MAG TPA: aminodeoxychorismate/anthranilate synthase component II [Prolixibacteraceae bacterium]|nr:aminodeoxychorismate/anthranilate synthase component II [Prolixibacteraceae bacterium]
MKNILLIDNYDSFTYNLVHLIKSLGYGVDVRRNDAITIKEAEAYDKILLSPGPGIPSEAGLLLEIVRQLAPTKSILGVCLGHQAIGEVFGATLINIKEVHHGVASQMNIICDDLLFKGMERTFEAGRYHSWAVSPVDFPADLEITAMDDSGEIMALRHKKYKVRGVQFHPESVLTPMGSKIMQNWIEEEQ